MTSRSHSRARRRTWTMLLWTVGVAIIAAASISGTESTFSVARSKNQQIGTGPLIKLGLATASTAYPQNYSVTGLAPGSYLDQLANLQNDGTASTPDVELAISTSSSTSLDTDSTNGLTFQVDRCSVAWQQSAVGATAACNGTSATLYGPTALATAAASFPTQQYTSGYSAAVTSGIDHLRVRIALPATAPAGYSSLTSTPTVKLWGATSPAAPTVTLAPGDTTLTANWAVPNSYSLAISGYTATLSPGGTTCTTTSALTCSFSGLTNGAGYTVSVTATNSIGTGTAGVSATGYPYPALITGTGSVLWLDATDATTLFSDLAGTVRTTTGSGQTVAYWKDKSGAGDDVKAGTVAAPNLAKAATTDTSTYSPRVSVSFSGTNFLTRSNGFPMGSDYTIVIAYHDTTNGTCTGNLVSSNSNGHAFYLNSGSGLTLFHGGAFASTTTGATAGVSYIGSGIWTNSTKVGSTDVNGATPVTGSSSNLVTDTSISIGAYNGGGNAFCGQIGEAMVFSRALSVSERRTVQEYLGRKWGTAIVATQPRSPVATAGTTSASVSFTAPTYDGGASITSYTVTSSPGSKTCSASTVSGCTVTGLTTGTAYTFTVQAVNSAGASLASAASNSVTAG